MPPVCNLQYLSVCLSVWWDHSPANSRHPCDPLLIRPWISHPFHFYRWLVRSCCLADSATVERFFFPFSNLSLRGNVCFRVSWRLVRRRRHQRLRGVPPQLRDLQRAGWGRLPVMCGRRDAGRWHWKRRVPVRARGLSRKDLSQRWDFLHIYILLIHLSTYNEGGIWAPCRGQGEVIKGNWFLFHRRRTLYRVKCWRQTDRRTERQLDTDSGIIDCGCWTLCLPPSRTGRTNLQTTYSNN